MNEFDIIVKFLIDQAARGNTEQSLELLENKFKQFDERIQETKKSLRELREVSRGLGQVAREISLVGLAITGGIFAAADNYVKKAKQANEVTIAWKASQDSLGKSGDRVGFVLARETLPLLQKVAELADKAAGFVESHPGIVRAALNTGIVLAGLGAVGVAVIKGIRLYTDVAFAIAVAEENAGINRFAIAVHEFYAAATGQFGGVSAINKVTPSSGLTGLASGAGKIIQIAGTVTLLATAVLLGAEIGNFIGNAIAKAVDPKAKNMTLNETLFFGGVRAFEAVQQKFLFMASAAAKFLSVTEYGDKIIDKGTETLNESAQSIDRFFHRLLIGSDAVDNAATGKTGVAASPAFDEILDAYKKYRADDLNLVQDHYKDRQKIVDDALTAENTANARYAKQVASVNQQMGSSLAKAASEFSRENSDAETRYNQERAQIIRDGNQEIADIQKASQEKLKKMARDHGERVDELTAARDALGLVKENRKYRQDVQDEKSQAQKEISDRRRAIAQRLADLQASYESEREQRLAEYIARRAEIVAQAKERLAELQAEHLDEIKQIRAQKIIKLKELDQQFIEERKRRYQQFIQQIRDLDASLLGERDLRLKYQEAMIKDLDAFLKKYQDGLGTLSATAGGKKAGGGYATYGMYLLGDQPGGGSGRPEYVINSNTTENLEKMIGGSITPERLMAAMSGQSGGGESRSVQYNDNRRIDSRISAADRERLRQDALGVVMEAIS